MIRLKHGRHIFTDGTKHLTKVPVKAGEIIKEDTFITFEDGKIVNATAGSQSLAISKNNVVGSDKECSVVFIRVYDGLELDIDANGDLQANLFYTLADNETIDAGTGSTTPIASAWNFEFDGDTFIARSIGF